MNSLTPHVSRRLTIGQKQLLVLDGLFPPKDIVSLHGFLRQLPYRLNDTDSDETAYSHHWKAELPVDMALATPVFRRCIEADARADRGGPSAAARSFEPTPVRRHAVPASSICAAARPPSITRTRNGARNGWGKPFSTMRIANLCLQSRRSRDGSPCSTLIFCTAQECRRESATSHEFPSRSSSFPARQTNRGCDFRVSLASADDLSYPVAPNPLAMALTVRSRPGRRAAAPSSSPR